MKLVEEDSLFQAFEERSGRPSCINCGFIAKNIRGLNIYLHTCNKRNLSSSNNAQTCGSTPGEDLIHKLISLRSGKRIMNRIPKGARKLVCEEYTKTIIECTRDNSDNSWDKLLTFIFNALQLPPKGEKRKCSLATTIRKNILHPDLSTNTKFTTKNIVNLGIKLLKLR